MQVYMLKDVEKVGIAGTVVKVSDGYAANFLIPNKLGVKVTEANMEFLKERMGKQKVEEQVINSKVAMLAERIKLLNVSIKERVHDNGKLYGSVGADEIVALLEEKGFSINKKQVEFDKTIKSVGEYKVTIKLSSKLKPQFSLKVVAAAQ